MIIIGDLFLAENDKASSSQIPTRLNIFIQQIIVDLFLSRPAIFIPIYTARAINSSRLTDEARPLDTDNLPELDRRSFGRRKVAKEMAATSSWFLLGSVAMAYFL